MVHLGIYCGKMLPYDAANALVYQQEIAIRKLNFYVANCDDLE